jgi:hypothetical protein
MQSDLYLVQSDDDQTTGVSQTQEFSHGEITVTFHQIDPPKLSRYTESFEIDIEVVFTDSEYITEYKPALYEFANSIQPDRSPAVVQDYPTSRIRYKEEMSESEVENLLDV